MSRGFTLLELAICISITALLAPLVFAFGRTFENDHHRAIIEAESARAMRSFSEELRRDLQQARVADEPGLVLVGTADCPRIEYAIQDEVLLRRADPGCGGVRPVARPALSLRHEGGSVLLELGRPLLPDLPVSVKYRLALPEGGAR